jgi:hypothetical protein
VHACRAYQASTFSHKIRKVFAVVAFALGWWWLVYVSLSYWVGVLLLVLAVSEWFDLSRLLRVWSAYRRDPGSYTQNHEVTIDGEGLKIGTAETSDTRLWSEYSALLESDKVFVLVYGQWLYTTIPKRAFSGEGDIAAFRKLASRAIAGEA